MNFRTRLTVIFLLAVLVPMAVLTLFIRNEMAGRLTEQYRVRVESLISIMRQDLRQKNLSLSGSLDQICRDIVNDNRFRRAVVDRDQGQRRYLLDYAGEVMRLTGLSMLQIQDGQGRIISSGHFRNEYGRIQPVLPRLLSSAGSGPVMVSARAPRSTFIAMARVDSLSMSGKQFFVIGGIRIEPGFLNRLARGERMRIVLDYPGGVISSEDENEGGGSSATLARETAVPFADLKAGAVTEAYLRVSHDMEALGGILGSIDRWFLIVVAVTVVLAVIMVGWVASRISRPLEELAGKTERLDLNNLDIDFDTERSDEIGKLSRVLNAMTERLKRSAAEIRNAERRATLGEMARQVNHDIKNGLAPIRNIFRHLSQLAGKDAETLDRTFRERKGSLDSSISYLEELASNYAGITNAGRKGRFDANRVIGSSLGILRGIDYVDLSLSLCEEAEVKGDPVALQRVMENLLKNARDALKGKPGRVTVSTAAVKEEHGEPVVRISIADTGEGISEEERKRIFEHFYTTRDQGTGLGLSIVQRLVRDLDGSIRVASVEGEGTTFTVEIPLAAKGRKKMEKREG